jgi:hypothetical protein
MNDYERLAEMGWGHGEETPRWGGANSWLLLIASGMYWGPIWLASGLPPLASLMTRLATSGRDRR